MAEFSFNFLFKRIQNAMGKLVNKYWRVIQMEHDVSERFSK